MGTSPFLSVCARKRKLSQRKRGSAKLPLFSEISAFR